MMVNELMNTVMVSVSPDTPVRDVARLMAENNIGILPVCDEGHIVGLVTDQDIVTRCVSRDDAAINNCAVRDILTADIVCSHDRQDIQKVAEIVVDLQLRRLPVLDDNAG
ncbi:CBS domain-containing protein [Marimonas arenosa]|uniref:CBS domain-containing protein n=1 Tax=Marimonas arenosa TaxID=1795305 RepID=A0AAE3WA56_9RHOB|nr:CBS domain-containing protein [Marimonas arenosa]MDQ2088947.1 CBS domain-containing protein [Marimonas arenosa]